MRKGKVRPDQSQHVIRGDDTPPTTETENTRSVSVKTPIGQQKNPGSLHAINSLTFTTDLAEWMEQVYPARFNQSLSATRISANNTDRQLRFDAQEDIAKRIAQNLHDDASQMLAVISLRLANISLDCPEPTANRLDSVSRQLDEVCEHIRRLSHELRPIALERAGLKSALRLLAESARKRFNVDVSIAGDLSGISADIEIGLYRITQEALSNIYQHANATRVEITLKLDDQTVFCTITDNGCGIQQQSLSQKTGLGLIGILERVQSMNGTCTLTSRLNHGLSLDVEIPR